MKKLLAILLLIPSFVLAETVPVVLPTLTEYAQSVWKVYPKISQEVIDLIPADAKFYFRVPIGSATYCFSRSIRNMLQYSFDAENWQYVAPQVAIAILPVPLVHIQVCSDTLPLPPVVKWRVAPNPVATDIPPTRPMKNTAMLTIKDRIIVGTACEDELVKPINSTQEYHWAVNGSGVRGVTVCVEVK